MKLLIKIAVFVYQPERFSFWVLALLVASNTNHGVISYAIHIANSTFPWESLQPSRKWVKQSLLPDSPERKPSGNALCEQAD